MRERKLKVREGRRDYHLKDKGHKGNPIVPFVLLKGTWLEKAGFAIGSPIRVQVKKGRLIIIQNA